MRIKAMRGKGMLGLILALTVCAVLLLPHPSPAVEKTWIVGTAWWHLAGNWTPQALHLGPFWIDGNMDYRLFLPLILQSR